MKKANIRINNMEFVVEIADTPLQRRVGASNTDSFEPNNGILLIFDEPDYYWVWMKNVRFPLDIIWINKQEIVDLKEKIAPSPPLTKYFPSKKATYILEINAGTCERYGFSKGEKIKIDYLEK